MPLLNPPRKPGSVPESDPQLLNPEHPSRNRQGANAPPPPQPVPSQGGGDDGDGGGGFELDEGNDQDFLTWSDAEDEPVWTELHRETFTVYLTGLVAGQDYIVAIDHSLIGAWSKLTSCRVNPDCDLTKLWISRGAQGDDETLYLGISLAADIDAGTYGGATDLELDIELEGFFFTAGAGGAAVAVATAFQGLYADFVNVDGDTMTGGLLISAAGGTVNSKALLELVSTTKGFLLPRMTTAERDAITSPPAALEIYNLTTNKKNFYNGSAWEVVTSA